MRLSFIIPVYNAENFIVRCVYSIVNQPFDNVQYEILLVNDGSSDSSDTLCRQLEQENPQVKYFSKENRGPGHSRNYGLDRATGEYIWFIDADDYLEPLALGSIWKHLEDGIELYLFGYQTVDMDNNILGRLQFRSEVITSIELLQKELFINMVWCKLIKRDILLKHKLRFNEEVKGPEDTIFSFKLLSQLKLLKTLDIIAYNYIVNPNSIQNTSTVGHLNKRAKDSIIAGNIMRDEINHIKDKSQKLYFDHWLSTFLYGFLFSMFRYNYKPKFIKEALIELKTSGNYPIKIYTKKRKRALFTYIANKKILFLFLVYLNRSLK